MTLVKAGTWWQDRTDDLVRCCVISVVDLEGQQWVHYRLTVANGQEDSCWLETFLERYQALD